MSSVGYFVYPKLSLYITPDRFYFEPEDERNNLLVVDRVSGAIALEVNVGQIPLSSGRREVYGILGRLDLMGGSGNLLLATGREAIGELSGQKIWKLTKWDVLPYSRTDHHLTESQIRMDKEYKAMVDLVLSTPHLYFSYGYDLTHSLQRLNNTPPEFLKTPLHKRGDQRFVWNGYLLNCFTTDEKFAKFCLPIMMGFVSIDAITLRGVTCTLSLLSRRSLHRAGTRLFSRGSDASGSVSNFVETEQILETPSGDRASFLQTRGSMPFVWEQWPNLRYKPRPKIIDEEDVDQHREILMKHFDSQLLEYGKQIIINLVNQTGSEGELERFYRGLVESIGNPDIRYEAFDFHAECSKMRWDRLEILIQRLAQDQENMGVTLLLRDSSVSAISFQDGVFRTNCIDCLDRTNVVQSMLARKSLEHVLKKLSLLRSSENLPRDHPGIDSLFKSVWAENADVLSIQYSGTGALKTDFTRTGKRSWSGILRDGLNSATRYYRNNFTHGFRQDALDLFLGNYIVDPGEGVICSSPLESRRGWRYITFPLILLVAIAMFFANLVTPTDHSTGTLLSLLFWGLMIALTSFTIMFYGEEYVDSPRLVISPSHPPSPSAIALTGQSRSTQMDRTRDYIA